MGGILDILKYIWQGRQGQPMGQNNPMLTPGYNGQPNPADEIMRRQQAPSPIQSGSLPPIQQQPSGGLKGLLQNPQLLQGLAQIALSQGDYGGARGAGFSNQINTNNQLKLQQDEAAERSRQFNEEIGLKRQQLESDTKQRNTTSMAQLIPIAESMGTSIQEAADYMDIKVDPVKTAKLDEARAKRSKAKLTYVDVNPDSESYGEIVPVPDPENPYHYGMETKIATQLAKSLKKPKVTDEFYVNKSGNLISKMAYDALPVEAKSALEGPFPAAQAITRAGQVNVKPVAGRDVPFPPEVEKQKNRIAAAGKPADIGQLEETPIDASSKSILAQTGLSLPAFAVITGNASSLPRDKATRVRAFSEAQKFANQKGVDVSTIASQYKTYNEVLSKNISRLNSTKIMEDELQGTIENLQGVAKESDLKKLRFANVAKIWAGQEVNDSLAQQYAMHLYQLRQELAAYGAATQGRSGNEITMQDMREAENTIKNGIAKGSLDGLATAVANSTGKMNAVMQRSVKTAQKAIWELFGVGQNYQSGAGAKSTATGNSEADDFLKKKGL